MESFAEPTGGDGAGDEAGEGEGGGTGAEPLALSFTGTHPADGHWDGDVGDQGDAVGRQDR